MGPGSCTVWRALPVEAGVGRGGEPVASGCAGFSIVELATAGEGVVAAAVFIVAASFEGASVCTADSRGGAAFCVTVCCAAFCGDNNFQAINIPSPSRSNAAAPNPAITNQMYFGNEGLDVTTGGCGRAASRGRIPGFGDGGPLDGRDSEVGIGPELLAELREGGSIGRRPESDASTRWPPTEGTTSRSEHLGQRTFLPASSSGTLNLCPALQVNSIAIAAPAFD